MEEMVKNMEEVINKYELAMVLGIVKKGDLKYEEELLKLKNLYLELKENM